MSECEIRSRLEKGDSLSFKKTAYYKKVYKLTEARTGRTLAREMLPGIQLTRKLTTT